jgi:hypothetical protein
MDIIKNYLDNIFVTLPKNKEMERLKNEIYYNMEERYHELKSEGKPENEAIGIVISEFGNVNELLEEMGIDPTASNGDYTLIDNEESRLYISLKKKTSRLIGIGVGMILFGVSLLILLSQLMDRNLILQTLPQDTRETLPVIILLLLIIPAVVLFIYSGSKLQRFKFIEDGQFEITSDLRYILKKELNDITPKQTISIITGVSLCIFSVVVLLAFSLFQISDFGVCVMLLIIDAAVYILITGSSTAGAYEQLLKIEDYEPVKKKNQKAIGAVAAIVWPIAVCIFLFCGFVLNLWGICWIVFPITGILFGGFTALYNSINAEK